MADGCKLVFVVDDDQAVCDALQFALRLEGLCVHAHSGGAALLADPDVSRAACVILGDRMRHMDGFTLLSNLKERDIRPPAIMLSSHATPGVRARADAVGVRTVLEKPLLDNALVENVRSILNANQ
jgi:two-component system, LuxR family, response regulator FixJ